MQATATSFELDVTGELTNGLNVRKIILKASAQTFATQITGQFHASRQALRYITRCGFHHTATGKSFNNRLLKCVSYTYIYVVKMALSFLFSDHAACNLWQAMMF